MAPDDILLVVIGALTEGGKLGAHSQADTEYGSLVLDINRADGVCAVRLSATHPQLGPVDLTMHVEQDLLRVRADAAALAKLTMALSFGAIPLPERAEAPMLHALVDAAKEAAANGRGEQSYEGFRFVVRSGA